MKLLITGICGFVGSSLAESLLERCAGISILGIDNLMRPGSELNRVRLRKLGATLIHGDIRLASDFESLPAVDWVIDAAANPSVLAGIQSGFSSRQLLEHNLVSVVNVLEYCKTQRAGLVLLSTSRVYSIEALASLPLRADADAFHLDENATLPAGVSLKGIGVNFSTCAPISLYGSSKLACGDHRAGIWRRLRISGVDQSLRRAGRGRAVRHARSGHLLVLDPCPCADAVRFDTSVSTARASKSATCFIRAISLL